LNTVTSKKMEKVHESMGNSFLVVVAGSLVLGSGLACKLKMGDVTGDVKAWAFVFCGVILIAGSIYLWRRAISRMWAEQNENLREILDLKNQHLDLTNQHLDLQDRYSKLLDERLNDLNGLKELQNDLNERSQTLDLHEEVLDLRAQALAERSKLLDMRSELLELGEKLPELDE